MLTQTGGVTEVTTIADSVTALVDDGSLKTIITDSSLTATIAAGLTVEVDNTSIQSTTTEEINAEVQ
jgi:hypothetical protein